MSMSMWYGVRGASWGMKHVCDALLCLERAGGGSVLRGSLERKGWGGGAEMCREEG